MLSAARCVLIMWGFIGERSCPGKGIKKASRGRPCLSWTPIPDMFCLLYKLFQRKSAGFRAADTWSWLVCITRYLCNLGLVTFFEFQFPHLDAR